MMWDEESAKKGAKLAVILWLISILGVPAICLICLFL